MEPYIKPYDEVDVHRNGKVSGGARKSVMIYDSLEVTFHPPALHKLVNQFRAWFRERYRVLERRSWMFSEESDPEDFDAIEARHRTLCDAMRKRDTKACVR